ncbi:YicC/YloC family endoribonuclease [Clostridium tarantellae]|uniref:YicC family protein n=1 Tax=Clostridium tarantellae TaxID=39493 RepID=A0A6I1MQA4_9CLOT|nr:YicC/YloC family endoribonuclease [Clostridium tarantellae]MPQ42459.1 YicC family protein [Clostridium tarantellae]
MVKSMTGFGRATSEEGKERSFSLEIKSVNHRYLDINIRMPRSMISLEEKIRKIVSERLNRGKVDIFINCKNYGKGNDVAKLNSEFAESYIACLEELQQKFGFLKNDLTLSLVAKHPEIIVVEEKEENLEEAWNEINLLLKEALDNMIQMRSIEGEKLAEDILLKCNFIESSVKRIEEKSDTLVGIYKIKLEEKIKELLTNVEIDENRIAMEVAIFADKATIDEEIIRLNSHISQLRETLTLKDSIGRKLDFIIQEMNRETNTIASKSTDIEITNIVIDIKNIIEKIREQIQNME